MATDERVVIDPGVHDGQPVIRGTRVPVARILGSLAGGMTFAAICREYAVSREDVQAALAFAAKVLESRAFRLLVQPDPKRSARFEIIQEVRAAFGDVPDEELEREVAKAVAAARTQLRAATKPTAAER